MISTFYFPTDCYRSGMSTLSNGQVEQVGCLSVVCDNGILKNNGPDVTFGTFIIIFLVNVVAHIYFVHGYILSVISLEVLNESHPRVI